MNQFVSSFVPLFFRSSFGSLVYAVKPPVSSRISTTSFVRLDFTKSDYLNSFKHATCIQLASSYSSSDFKPFNNSNYSNSSILIQYSKTYLTSSPPSSLIDHHRRISLSWSTFLQYPDPSSQHHTSSCEPPLLFSRQPPKPKAAYLLPAGAFFRFLFLHSTQWVRKAL